jgi:flagellar capping protein FliD
MKWYKPLKKITPKIFLVTEETEVSNDNKVFKKKIQQFVCSWMLNNKYQQVIDKLVKINF